MGWFGHVERKQPDDWVSACRHIVVESVKGRGRGRPRKTLRECVEEDVGNEGRGYAKTRKNRENDDQMDVRCKTE